MIFASNNKHKLEEVSAILGCTLETPASCGITEEIPETSPTLEGNALQKAQYIYDRVGGDVFADDTGLEVEALNGEPGVYSARYAARAGCKKHDFAANNALLLKNLAGQSNRRARFRTVIALIYRGEEHLFEGRVEGEIILEAKGTEGFGYDPIFRPIDSQKTFAEMTAAEKNTLSHRGRAVEKLQAFLKQHE